MKKVLILLPFLTATVMTARAQNAGNPYAYAGATPGLVEGVVVETVYTHTVAMTDASGSTIPEGSVTYRLYVDLLENNDFVTAIGAENGCGWEMKFETTTGFYNNSIFGAESAQGINPGLFGFFGTIQYDTWYTIGAENQTNNCNGNGIVLMSPTMNDNCAQPTALTFTNNPGTNFCRSNGGYYIQYNNNPCGFGTGPENRLLIGQFTTDGVFSWQIGQITLIENAMAGQGQTYVAGLTLAEFANCPSYNNPSINQYFENATCLPGFSSQNITGTSCSGCTDSAACNFSNFAIEDDGSCSYTFGCGAINACNYEPNVCNDPSLCIFPGCTNAQAINFDPNAGCNDGSCVIPTCGPSSPEVFTVCYNNNQSGPIAVFTAQPGQQVTVYISSGFFAPGDFLSIYDGTTLIHNFPGNKAGLVFQSTQGSLAFHVTSNASFSCSTNNGSPLVLNVYCHIPNGTTGCLDPSACNYDAQANISDGSCVLSGCTNPNYCQYNPAAGCDNGSCLDLGQSTVTGFVYQDANNNGQFTGNFFTEPSMANIQVNIQPANLTVFTDLNGQFQVALPSGTQQTFTAMPNGGIYSAHPTGGIKVVTVGACNTNVNTNLGVVSTENINLNVSGPCCIWMMDLHCNNGMNPGLMVSNVGTVPLNGTVTVSFNPILTAAVLNASNVIAPTNIGSGVVTWNINNHLPGQTKLYQCHINGPGVDYIGQVFPINLNLNIVNTGGTTVYNNNWVLNPQVVCAYDPNDKYAVPEGYTEEHHFVPAEDEIEYRVRFQNTGNFPAEYITVIDSLDTEHLDLSTFQTMFASHNMQTCLNLNSGVVQFKFPNIMLPDSTSDEPGSQGYLVYRIRPLPGIAPGAVINNTAYIYFEENPPIVTNTTWHTIVNCSGLANITVNSVALCENYTASFSANEPYIQNFVWTMDNFNMGLNQEFAFTAVPGAHTIGLTASHPLCTETSQIEIFVNATTYGQFSDSACEGQEVQLPDGSMVTETGVFTITTPSAETGCDHVITATVTIHPAPVAEINQNGIILSATEGTFWQWFLNDTAIDGADEQSFTATESGLYTVLVTNQFGCSELSEGVLVTSVGENTKPNLLLYPNPMGQTATLVLGAGFWSVDIYDANGRKVRGYEGVTDRLEIFKGEMTAGVYTLVVRDEAGAGRELRLVVE